MGGVVSTVKILLAFCWSLNSSLTPLVKRIHSDPGRPSANPTKSFWLSRPHPHVAAHQSPSLPTEVDVVIIGSGITGTAVAKTLLLLQQLDDGTPSLRVAMLDARDACSGATGRNGGHIKESAYLEYAGLKKKYGKAVAMEVVRFRLAHLDALVAVAEAEGADVVRESRIRRCDTADVCFEESVWEGSKRKLEVFLEDFEDQRGLWVVHEAEEARKIYPFPSAIGAISSPAGSLWPYRLLTPLLSRLLLSYPANFTLDTSTPALSISAPASSHPDHYLVSTPRGNILTRHIIHATNAHASHLLPGLRGLLFPVRGHMSAQSPTTNLPGGALDALGRSYTLLWAEGFDYLTQLPASPSNDNDNHDDDDGDDANMVMLGGGLFQSCNMGFTEIGERADDDVSLFASAHVAGILQVVVGRPGCVSVDAMWTGSMGFTPDGMPWVGAVAERMADGRRRPEGGREWIVAGFCGEGMVNAWGCGVALARMVCGEREDEVGLPAPMLMTEERVGKASLLELATEWFGQMG